MKLRINQLFTALCTFYKTRGKNCSHSFECFSLRLLTSAPRNPSNNFWTRCAFSLKKTNFCSELRDPVWEVQCQLNAVDELFQGRIFKESNTNGKRVSTQWDCRCPCASKPVLPRKATWRSGMAVLQAGLYPRSVSGPAGLQQCFLNSEHEDHFQYEKWCFLL